MEESKIFNFTPSGLIGDITFKSHTDKEFSVAGYSLVRRGNSIHWVLLGGEKLSQAEWDEIAAAPPQNEMGDSVPSFKRRFVQSLIEEKGPSAGLPTPLEGTTSTHRSVLAGEIDIPTGKIIGRFCATEYEHAFTSVCDEPGLFDYLGNPVESAKRQKVLAGVISELAVLWAVSESLISLPHYLSVRINYDEKSEFGNSQRTKLSPNNSIIGSCDNVYIPSIERSKGDTLKSFVAPDYKIETKGYWRRLEIGQVGTDPHGKAVKGKTWVNKDASWRDGGQLIKTVYVKNTLSSALAKRNDLMRRLAGAADDKHSTERGVLYVLRCVFMVEEVYKIGWTSGTAAERAKELSRATGVPKAFDVVASWKNRSARELEANVHAVLDQYRLNDSREFFKIKLDEVERVVELEAARLASR